MRTESDLLGELQIPETAYYGVQTQRAINNFKISNNYLSHYPEFVKALGVVKLGAAQANHELGILSKELFDAISFASNELIAGKYTEQFPIDMIQGGAGTSTNMNANEVIANIALEHLGKQKGEYQFCSPNDHVNLSQSTNDAYPSALKLALFNMNKPLIDALTSLYEAFDKKGKQFSNVIKMGRTQLQDAVPMTLGQEFEGFSNTLNKEVDNLNRIAAELLVINMGATAIGTGLNAVPGYAQLCTTKIAEIMNEDVSLADNLVEATSDTSSFVDYSSALKRLCVKLSKICNDLRLLTSGPRTGLFGNDLSITMAAEAGQLQLNMMEPIIGFSIMESIQYLTNAMNTLRVECIDGITANVEHLKNEVQNSIGIVTALNPYIGYKASTKIAKEALETGGSVYQLVLDHGLLSKERLDEILDPKNMLGPHI